MIRYLWWMGAVAGLFAAGVIAGGENLVPYQALRARLTPASADHSRVQLMQPRFEFLRRFRAAPGGTVMFGDSLTHNADWTQIFPGAGLINRGIGGITLAELSENIDLVLDLRPRRVFIMAGINDIFLGVETETLLVRYKDLIASLQGAGIEVVVQSTIDCTGTVCGPARDQIRELNAVLAGEAESGGWTYIDLNKVLSDPGTGLLAVHTHDGVHLSSAGYAVWAGEIAALIGQTPATPE